jgi:hypothetical protein
LDSNGNSICDKDENLKTEIAKEPAKNISQESPKANITVSNNSGLEQKEKKIIFDVEAYYGDESGKRLNEVGMQAGWAYYYIWIINKGNTALDCRVIFYKDMGNNQQGAFFDGSLEVNANSNNSKLISSNYKISSTQIANVKDREIICESKENSSLSKSIIPEININNP